MYFYFYLWNMKFRFQTSKFISCFIIIHIRHIFSFYCFSFSPSTYIYNLTTLTWMNIVVFMTINKRRLSLKQQVNFILHFQHRHIIFIIYFISIDFTKSCMYVCIYISFFFYFHFQHFHLFTYEQTIWMLIQ